MNPVGARLGSDDLRCRKTVWLAQDGRYQLAHIEPIDSEHVYLRSHTGRKKTRFQELLADYIVYEYAGRADSESA